MNHLRLVSAVAAASVWVTACSSLFDADRGQCRTSADCAQLGHAELSCVDSLCTVQGTGSPQQAADAGAMVQRDAATRDAGSPDEGDHDAGSDMELPPEADAGDDDPAQGLDDCPPASEALRFCDGFEDDFAPWNRQADPDTKLTIVSSDAARGAHALEVDVQGGRKSWAEVNAEFAGISGEPLWVRAYLWAQGDMSYDVVTVLRVETRGDTPEGVDLSLSDGAARAVLYAEAGESEAEVKDGRRFPADTWTCIELSLTPSDSRQGVARLYVEGRLAATLDTPLPRAPLERVRAGLFFASDDQPPVSLRLDAVAVGTERIGCD